MNAGRELDAAIAVKAYGWVWLEDQDQPLLIPPRTTRVLLGDTVWETGGYPTYLPHYSTDIAAAWPLAERFGLVLVPVEVWTKEAYDDVGPNAVPQPGYEWSAFQAFSSAFRVVGEPSSYYGNIDELIEPETIAATAPLAICRAVLRILELEQISRGEL